MKNKILIFLVPFVLLCSQVNANTPKSIGKFKNWQSFVLVKDSEKICFAQTIPSKREPGAFKRNDSRLFVTFRPNENIIDEVSITSGHQYKPSSVSASSGKRKFSFFSQDNFAWLLDNKEEKKFIKLMKRATNLIVVANATNGTRTKDHYSMMGFTKAYNAAKQNCN